MKASLVAKAIASCFKTRRPVFIWGPPGIGKSHTVAQVAQEMGCKFYDIRATQLDPVDLRGVPKVVTVNGIPRTIWALPNLLPTEDDLREHNGAVVFFDELNAAPPSMQATFYQIIQDRKCGDYVAPDNVFFIAAGNRETDRAVVNRMPTPLTNKFIHLDFEVDCEELIAYAIKRQWSPFIIAWFRFRPALVYSFNPDNAGKQFASPRTYEYASDLLTRGEIEEEVEFDLLKGTLGEGVATEFVAFLKICRNLPDPDHIIANPTTAKVPTADPATAYALVGVLSRKATEKNIEAIFQYIDRMDKEYSVLFVRDINKVKPALTKTAAFVKWAVANKDVLI